MPLKSRIYLLTINNPTQTLKEITDLAFEESSHVVAQLERGEQGTLHCQMYVYLKDRQRPSYVKKLFPTAHIEMADNAHAVSKYCKKEDTRVEGPIELGVMPSNIVRKPRDYDLKYSLPLLKEKLDAGTFYDDDIPFNTLLTKRKALALYVEDLSRKRIKPE